MEQSFVVKAGQAFGDGAHPSTALALWLLAALPPDFMPRRVLDIGCGSGILSLAAAKKWGVPVLASDIDGCAVMQAKANAETNGLEANITVLHADGARHPAIAAGAPYDLLMSNILADLHIRHAREFAAQLTMPGYLLLSGVLAWRVTELLGYYDALGFAVRREERDSDWVALLLARKEAG